MGGQSHLGELEITYIKASREKKKSIRKYRTTAIKENTNRFLRNNGQGLSQVN